jgi:hypothetical protein
MKKVLTWIFVILIGISLFYLWYGFLFPDPFYLSQYSFIARLKYLWIPRIFIPLLYCVFIIVIVMINRKLAQNITVMIFTLIMLAIITYSISAIRTYSKSQQYSNKIFSERYHPYLQLKPPRTDQLDSIHNKGTFKIFCLGGSTTEFKDSKGIGWPERLEKELQEVYKSDPIIVYNSGKQWYTTLHSLINYEVNLRHYKPDVIILMHNINDLLQNADFSYFSTGTFREDYGHFMGPTANILKRTGLLGSLWTNFRTMWNYKPRILFEQDSFPGLVSFTRNINTLIDLASMDSTKVILMTQPNIFSEKMDEQLINASIMVNREAIGKNKKWGFQTAYAGMKQYNERIREISEDRKVYFIDLEKHIPKSLIYFTDDVHYTDTTFNIISKVLKEEIVRSKVIQQ